MKNKIIIGLLLLLTLGVIAGAYALDVTTLRSVSETEAQTLDLQTYDTDIKVKETYDDGDRLVTILEYKEVVQDDKTKEYKEVVKEKKVPLHYNTAAMQSEEAYEQRLLAEMDQLRSQKIQDMEQLQADEEKPSWLTEKEDDTTFIKEKTHRNLKIKYEAVEEKDLETETK